MQRQQGGTVGGISRPWDRGREYLFFPALRRRDNQSGWHRVATDAPPLTSAFGTRRRWSGAFCIRTGGNGRPPAPAPGAAPKFGDF